VRYVLVACWGLILTGCVAERRVRDASPPEPPPAEALDAQIDPANFDRGRLALAIFHETNRVRRSLGLPPFRWLAKLTEAADLEAAIGKVYQPPSHTNPFPMMGTPTERVKFVGLEPGRVAENIAVLPIYDVPPLVGVGVVIREGKKHFVNPDTYEDRPPASYRKIASNVVQAWMDSPGHRVNISNPALTYLGCSVQPGVSLQGVDQLFCVQVFFSRAL
jgi:uncharacterized protein YkwD